MRFKKNLYIFSYVIIILIICTLNMLTMNNVLSLNLPLTDNPIYFFILDFILIFVIMKNLKKEAFILQQRVIDYFISLNNLFLFFALIYSGSLITLIINMLINIFLIYLLRPLSVNPNIRNGVEEYFKKYNHTTTRFYNDIDEVKQEYIGLKQEVEVEIPALKVEIKDEQKNKRRKVLNRALPILVILLFFTGMILSLIDMLKTFERARYHYYEVYLNEEKINIYYEEEYYNVVIPVVYIQKENKNFYTSDNFEDINNKIKIQNNFILDLKEYECYNNEKGNNVKVSCDGEALSETTKEIALVKNVLTIKHQDKTIYKGVYKKDITKYLQEPGIYTFEIKNKRDKISTDIKFIINLNEKIVDE